MRIINGRLKGRQIYPPKYFKARPTTDVAKEGLFNVLENYYYLDCARVMDIFSGTGSISYEFASRGCNDITTIELNQKYYNFIKSNIEKFELNQIQLINADFFKFPHKRLKPFDIIFADPPFDMVTVDRIPEIVFKNNMLTKIGWLIIEHSKKYNFETHPNFEKQKRYGKVNFSFFAPNETFENLNDSASEL